MHLPLGAKPEVAEKYKARIRPDVAQKHPVYGGMVEGADDSVGRIMKKLDDLNLTDSTVIFFLSDNGGLRFEGKADGAHHLQPAAARRQGTPVRRRHAHSVDRALARSDEGGRGVAIRR